MLKSSIIKFKKTHGHYISTKLAAITHEYALILREIQGSIEGTIQLLHLHTKRGIMCLTRSGLDFYWHEDTFNKN